MLPGYYNAAVEPGEKIEFSSLMYEIKVLPLNYPDLNDKYNDAPGLRAGGSPGEAKLSEATGFVVKGQYSELNREPTVPHTVALPIELYYP